MTVLESKALFATPPLLCWRVPAGLLCWSWASGHWGIQSSGISTVLTWLGKAFLTPHFGPASSKQDTDPLSPGCMTVSVCNPAAGTCHLEQRGLVQHATDRQPGHPLELSARRDWNRGPQSRGGWQGWGWPSGDTASQPPGRRDKRVGALHPAPSGPPTWGLHPTWGHCWIEWRLELWRPVLWDSHTSPGMPRGERSISPCCHAASVPSSGMQGSGTPTAGPVPLLVPEGQKDPVPIHLWLAG